METLNIKDIHYIAGLLEGEGTFTRVKRCPIIKLHMTDRDIVEKFKKITRVKAIIGIDKKSTRPECKKAYVISICGNLAASWMMILFTLMGEK